MDGTNACLNRNFEFAPFASGSSTLDAVETSVLISIVQGPSCVSSTLNVCLPSRGCAQAEDPRSRPRSLFLGGCRYSAWIFTIVAPTLPPPRLGSFSKTLEEWGICARGKGQNPPFADMEVLILIIVPYILPQQHQHCNQPTTNDVASTHNDKAASDNSSPPPVCCSGLASWVSVERGFG